jgi:hypothetical protein
MASMRPIPDVAGAPPIECPLPYVSQARLDQAHGSIAAAYEALRNTQLRGGSWRAMQQVALDALVVGLLARRGFTELEVVAYYALLREKIPTQTEADKDPEAAVKLAVWQAVAGG